MHTTDLATLVEREEKYDPDEVILRGGQASGTAFRTGLPLCEEDWNCKTGSGLKIPGIWYDEWKGR